jgi:hypothetical protein
MRRHGALLAGLLVVFGFTALLLRLLALRFEAGDVYPPYSSLRADPLGARALFESLAELPGMTVTRNYEDLPDLERPASLSLVLLGTSPRATVLPRQEANLLQDFVAGGGRLIIAFAPVSYTNYLWHTEDEKPTNITKKAKAPTRKSKTKDAEEDLEKRYVTRLTTLWGFELKAISIQSNAVATLAGSRDELPDEVSWHSTLVLTNLHDSWDVLYERRGRPVIAERKLGAGSIVLATDSYFTSNEALWKERQPSLLAHLFTGKSRVLFDETHLGVVNEEGVATLARKYRLHGVIAALLVLAGLFVWRQATPFVPPAETLAGNQQNHVAGRDAATGFINLLRRSIPRTELLTACLAQWERAFARSPQYKPDHVARARAAATGADPVAGYAAAQEILTERK